MSKPPYRPLKPAEQEATERLRKYWNLQKAKEGLTQAQVAQKLGFSTQGAVSHYLTGKIPVSVGAALQFASLLKIPPYWIRPDLKELLESVHYVEQGQNKTYEHKTHSVPLIKWSEAMEWKEKIDNYQAPPEGPRIGTHLPIQKHTYALRIRDDSMLPRFPVHGIVICEPQMEADAGHFVIIWVGKETDCVLRQWTGSYYKALNEAYPPIEPSSMVKVCAIVREMFLQMI